MLILRNIINVHGNIQNCHPCHTCPFSDIPYARLIDDRYKLHEVDKLAASPAAASMMMPTTTHDQTLSLHGIMISVDGTITTNLQSAGFFLG